MAILLASGPSGCTVPQTRFYKRYPNYVGEANQHTRLINAPPELIFMLITDPGQFTAMVPEHTTVSFDTPPPFRTGTRLKIRIDHLFKFTWHTQVREIVPNRMIRLTFLDGFFKGGTEIWDLQPEGRATRVIQTIIVAPRGFFRSLVWKFKARGRHNAIAEKFLDNLKARAESMERR